MQELVVADLACQHALEVLHFLQAGEVELDVHSADERRALKQLLEKFPLEGIELAESQVQHRHAHIHALLQPVQYLVVRVLAFRLAELEIGREHVRHVACPHEPVSVIEAPRCHVVDFLLIYHLLYHPTLVFLLRIAIPRPML